MLALVDVINFPTAAEGLDLLFRTISKRNQHLTVILA